MDQKTNYLNPASYIKPAKPIEESQFYQYLNCLPPGGWVYGGHVEHFYVIERIFDNIVTYCVAIGGKEFYSFQDVVGLSTDQVIERVKAYQDTEAEAQKASTQA